MELSKNLKIRHYGGSESSDFRTACGVAQHNEGHKYVSKTLLKIGITPGYHCTKHQENEDKKAINDRRRKSEKSFKRRRRQLHLNKIQSTARKEEKEGPSYGHNIGLNLTPQEAKQNDNTSTQILKSINTNICRAVFTKCEELIPSDNIRPSIKKISFDPQKTYKFVPYDIETASAARNAELRSRSSCPR